MKSTQLAEKRLKIISGSGKCWLEAELIKKCILQPEPTIMWSSGIELINVAEFCDRVHRIGGRVLGLHTSFDSPYLDICLPWELFSTEYDPDWVILALQSLQKNN